MKKNFLGIFFWVSVIWMIFGTTTTFAKSDENSAFPYLVKDGTIYYESADHFGSGRYGIVNEENAYTTIPCYCYINGYALLDEKGNIIDSDYVEDEKDILIPELPETFKVFKHFKTRSFRNGWVDASCVKTKEDTNISTEQQPDEQQPEEIVENIKDMQKKNPEKTTIVIDLSGSMSDNQKQVVSLLKTLDLKGTKIIVFADEWEIISSEKLTNSADEDFYHLGVYTHLVKALNEAIKGTENLLIISDLHATDYGVTFKESKTLKSVIVYDPDGTEEEIMEDMSEAWKVEVERIKIL